MRSRHPLETNRAKRRFFEIAILVCETVMFFWKS